MLDQRLVSVEHQRWLTKLLGCDFEIQYCPEVENKVVDALSHLLETIEFAALTQTTVSQFGLVDSELERDEKFAAVKGDILSGHRAPTGYTVLNNILLFQGKIVLTKDSSLIPMLLQEFHDSGVGGHLGVFKTYMRVSREFYWQGMKRRIQQYVGVCAVCQEHKYLSMSPMGLFQPLFIPKQIWEDVTMDFIEGLPKSEGMYTILVVVDRLSKYAHFVALRHPFTAQTIVAIFVKEVVKLHGIPRTITTNHDKVFTIPRYGEQTARYNVQKADLVQNHSLL